MPSIVLSINYVYAFTVYYGIAALWGLLATRNGLALILETGGEIYESIFTLVVALLSAVLAVLCLTDYVRVEKWVTVAWCVVVLGVPASAIYQWLSEGDISRAAPSASAWLYLVFPVTRLIYLILKTAKVKKEKP